ncbi:MAG: hypothetical protein F6K35_51040, partial [Okeania sp. SIO2H7]|nr:hypothetical protein [Okeania sp. SIO2H7]
NNIAIDLPFLDPGNLDNLPASANRELPDLISPNLAEIEPKLGAIPPLDFS